MAHEEVLQAVFNTIGVLGDKIKSSDVEGHGVRSVRQAVDSVRCLEMDFSGAIYVSSGDQSMGGKIACFSCRLKNNCPDTNHSVIDDSRRLLEKPETSDLNRRRSINIHPTKHGEAGPEHHDGHRPRGPRSGRRW